MPVWMVRAGSDGSRENFALNEGAAFIGFHEVGDLSDVSSKDELNELLSAKIDRGENAIANYTNQVWAFLKTIAVGDIVALPLKNSPAVALGIVKGDYEFDSSAPENTRHRRKVQWVREDVARSEFGQDLLYSLGAFLTVCQIKRNDAATRIEAIMKGKPDRGAGTILAEKGVGGGDDDVADSDEAEARDLGRYGRDRIQSLITRRFAGHELARLVEAILEAEGFETHLSPPGPDGGVDILAGSGAMGFAEPRLCVQVKTGTADAPMLRDLQGTMQNVGATQGLFVAWSGFKKTVTDDKSRMFFNIRLWDSDDVIDRLTAVYDRLPATLRDDLPLTQVWTVVEDEA